MDIALKIGSTYTSIYLSGGGVVLREPTVIAFNGAPSENNIRAIGYDAQAMIGKAVDKIVIISPVKNGVITDEYSLALLLRRFIAKLYPPSYVFKPRIKAVMAVPLGIEPQKRAVYENVALSAGISHVSLVPSILMSGVGIDLPINSERGGIIVNIGGGLTEIAVFALSEIISGYSVSIGGNMLDKAISDSLLGKYNLKIGLATARKLREDVGSLYKNDTASMIVTGMDITNKIPGKITVKSSDLYGILLPYYLKIADAVENVIKACPPEIAGELFNGIWVTGGASKIPGLSEAFFDRLKLRVNLVEKPELAAVVGGGKLISNRQLLNEIS